MWKSGGIVSKIAIGIMSSALTIALAAPAFAYGLTHKRMNGQIWYVPQSVFLDASRDAFRSAMSTWNQHLPEWRRVCFSNTNHTSTSYPRKDGLNLIYRRSVGTNNYVAENSYWWDSFNILTKSDININTRLSWINGVQSGCYDVRSVMTHEVGHTVGLDHSERISAVMYIASKPGTTKWYLTDDDINGIYAAY